ncbi:hypothetical protein ACH5RR_000875 [Cinchona calisaya]|uniref:Uncharacterized protein n=1 Tax=Cinchona calisaya TaxID=153742 RepID=A0ABD3B1Y2_9GENT
MGSRGERGDRIWKEGERRDGIWNGSRERRWGKGRGRHDLEDLETGMPSRKCYDYCNISPLNAIGAKELRQRMVKGFLDRQGEEKKKSLEKEISVQDFVPCLVKESIEFDSGSIPPRVVSTSGPFA